MAFIISQGKEGDGMDRYDILVQAKKTAAEVEKLKFRYSNPGTLKFWEGAKKVKKVNCALYVSLVLQQIGALRPGQSFYCNANGDIRFNGDGCEKEIRKKFKFLKGDNKKPADLKKELVAGDIILYKSHVNIFAGIDKEGKMVWYDAGKASTDTKKDGGTFVNIHGPRTINQKIVWIMRLR